MRHQMKTLFIASFVVFLIWGFYFATFLVHPTIEPKEVTIPLTHTDEATSNVDEATSNVDRCATPLHYLEKSTGGPLLLASYPGSGNTWVRHVIQEASRILTGSVYNDRSLIHQFPAEGVRSATVSVVKTHFPCKACWNDKFGKPITRIKSGFLSNYGGTIYVVRSPFDSILAEFNRKMADKNHTGVVDPEQFKSFSWGRWVEFRSKSWSENVKYYLFKHVLGRHWEDMNGKPVFVIYYESILSNFESEVTLLLTAIAHHHSMDASSVRKSVECALHNRNGDFKRSSKNRMNPFSDKHKAMICDTYSSLWHQDVWGACEGKLQWERNSITF